jgi:outer membrane protein assembly factor BamB
LFLSIDQDGNGRVSRQEFVASRRFVKDVVMEFFARDANLDGKLSNVEVTTYDRGSNEAMGHLLIPLFDLDHDRALSLEEFQRTPLANPILDWSQPRNDRNHDEKLTWSEFWSDQNDIVGMDLSRSMFGRFDRDSDGALTAKDTTGVAGKVAFEPEIAGHFLQWNGLRPAAVRQVRAVAAARIRPAPIAMMRGVVAINQAPAQAASEITANLNTSEEFERFLDRAEQLVTAGRPDLAPVLWQRVLDNGLGVLAPQANGVSETRLHSFKSYRPLHEEAVRRIVAAGPEALRQYRLTADAEARALLAHVAPEERETALAEVLRRFFLSSVGDDAAFELGCRRLERREYAGATQCFDRIKQYPDTDIPRSEIDIRLAVALSRLGSVSEASKFLEEESGIDPNLATVLKADFVSLGEQPVAVSEGSDGWRMMYGNSSRTGVPSAVTGFNWRAPLAEQWEYQPEFEMKAPPSVPTDGSRTAQAVINGRRVAILIDANNRVVRSTPTTADGGTITREELAARWNETHWRPVGGMLISGNRILIKSQQRIICCDAASGKVVWMGRKTAFPFDPETQEMLSLEAAGYRLADDSQSRPRSTTEVVLFADRIAQEMTVAGDLVLNLEGALDYGSKKAVPENQNDAIQQLFGGGGGARKPRLNWLTAYDATTGKLRWSITAADVAESGGCFLAAPLPVGERLVVPIGDDSHIDLAMLDRLTGSTVWKVTLCDRMAGGDAQAPVGISEADGTLYVSTGAGAVFALDSAAGDVKWVVSYPRRLSKQAINAQVPFQMMRGGNAPSPAVNQAEFRENLAISLPNLVVFLATDFDYLFALDPRNGALKWEAPLAPFRGAEKTDYCVGVREGRLFLAGAGVVRRYELSSGRIEWEHELLGSCGRGLATATGLYFPERYQIRRFDPDTGEDLGVTDVLTPKQEPLGNLFSEGGRLFAVGAARISRIASPEADAGGGS